MTTIERIFRKQSLMELLQQSHSDLEIRKFEEKMGNLTKMLYFETMFPKIKVHDSLPAHYRKVKLK